MKIIMSRTKFASDRISLFARVLLSSRAFRRRQPSFKSIPNDGNYGGDLNIEFNVITYVYILVIKFWQRVHYIVKFEIYR